MSLTPAQLTTLKAAILAETAGAFVTLRQVGAVNLPAAAAATAVLWIA